MPKNIYKYNYTYLITNVNSNMKYIGVRSCNYNPEEDEYWGSSKYIKEAIEKEGLNNFRKDILFEYSTRIDAISEEIRLHELYDVGRNPEFYNRCKQICTGWDVTGTKLSKETRLKMSTHQKGKITSDETKKKMSRVQKGKNSYKYSGDYITPSGEFSSIADVVNIIGVSKPTVLKWCKKNPTITNHAISRCDYLNISHLGKTSGELGFSFIPK